MEPLFALSSADEDTSAYLLPSFLTLVSSWGSPSECSLKAVILRCLSQDIGALASPQGLYACALHLWIFITGEIKPKRFLQTIIKNNKQPTTY